MKFIQVLPSLALGDAVGNDVLAIRKILREAGYDECIYAEGLGTRIPRDKVYPIQSEWQEPAPDDVIIYHLSIGWIYLSKIREAKCRKIAVYHNVTPASWFRPYSTRLYNTCRAGVEEVKSISDLFDYCLADSEFNKQDLISYGYTCPIDVVPILVPMDDYRQKPDRKVLKQFSQTKGANIVFIGRIAPNKKQEDLIAAFSLYQKYYDSDAKLFLVGSTESKDAYYDRLLRYVDALEVRNVYFTGHVTFQEILAYYSLADVFLCMSEHEGFCVPLVEAMLFQVPIIAYDAGAVGGTLGEGGILLREKDPLFTAGLCDRLIRDQALREKILSGQKQVLAKFRYESVRDLLLADLRAFLQDHT